MYGVWPIKKLFAATSVWFTNYIIFYTHMTYACIHGYIEFAAIIDLLRISRFRLCMYGFRMTALPHAGDDL